MSDEKPTEFSSGSLLPSSVPAETKNVKMHRGIPWVPIYCANCCADGGYIPEDTKDFAFYLCNPCGEKWAPLAGTLMVPDEVFWEKAKQAQIEACGREMLPHEVMEALKDDNHFLSKLVKQRYDWKRRIP